jgi:hypothetical protein
MYTKLRGRAGAKHSDSIRSNDAQLLCAFGFD